jgi:hypothetical protein
MNICRKYLYYSKGKFYGAIFLIRTVFSFPCNWECAVDANNFLVEYSLWTTYLFELAIQKHPIMQLDIS